MSTDVSKALEALEEQVREGFVTALDALARIHDERLYLAKFDSFDDYCRDRWGFSGRAGIRRLKQSEAMRELPPGAPVPSQREAERQLAGDYTMYPSLDANDHSSNAPDVVSFDAPNRPLDTITPDRVLPPPRKAKQSEGETAGSSRAYPLNPSGPSSEGGGQQPASEKDHALESAGTPGPTHRATPSGPSSEREPTTDSPAPASTLSDRSSAGGDTAAASAPPAGPNPTSPVPSLRQEASGVFAAVMNATEGFGAKLTVEEATAYNNRHEREMAAFRKANKIDEPKPEPRQGTTTYPKDRVVVQPKPDPALKTYKPVADLTRREVAPMFKKGS